MTFGSKTKKEEVDKSHWTESDGFRKTETELHLADPTPSQSAACSASTQQSAAKEMFAEI